MFDENKIWETSLNNLYITYLCKYVQTQRIIEHVQCILHIFWYVSIWTMER